MNEKITKRSHANKVFAHTYNVKILNILTPELQPQDTDSVIENKF